METTAPGARASSNLGVGTMPPGASSDAAFERPPHGEFLGLPFCLLHLAQAARLIIDRREGPFAYVVTPNSYHVVTVHDQPERLLAIYRGAWLSLCDSQIVRGLAAMEGLSLPLVTGSDLVAAILEDQNSPSSRSRGRKLLVVGPDAAAKRALHVRYPHADIEVLAAPAGLSERPDIRDRLARTCAEQQWDILMLCVGCPTQELIAGLIGQLGRRSGVALCVGAAIDFVIGRRARAPLWLQKLGLEWAYRLAHEPGRLWRRYLIESPKIIRLFLAARRARSSRI